MGLKTELLHESLLKLLEDIGYGGLSYVARQANLTAAGVKKIKERDGVPKLESWEKLHNAFPHQIPPPAFEGPATIVRADGGAKGDGGARAGGDEDGPARPGLGLVLVYDHGQDGRVQWNEAGLPTAGDLGREYLPDRWLDDKSFVLRVGDESMRPTLRPGDKALVLPSLQVESGHLCFAFWPDGGQKMIRRFRRSGLTIILQTDNPDHEPLVLDSQKDRGVKIYRVTKLIRDV